MKIAKAFVPGRISGFFVICDTDPDGTTITDLSKLGSQGGGPCLEVGGITSAEIEKADHTKIEVYINGEKTKEAQTTETTVNFFLDLIKEPKKVVIRHDFEIPIGCGFGASGAGALGTVTALNESVGIREKRLTLMKIGEIAHKAEVKCKTGLGTVGGMLNGGFAITLAPGFPFTLDYIPFPEDIRLISGWFGPILTKHILSDASIKETINNNGRLSLKKLLTEPSLDNFMKVSREFAEKTGMMTDRVEEALSELDKAELIGKSTMNMLGEAVFALIKNKHEDAVKDILSSFTENIIVSKINRSGVRLF